VRHIFVIGIGAGNPEHLTVQAIDALRQLDVVFVLNKGPDKDALLGLRRSLCERYLRDKPYRLVELSDPERDPRIADYRERVARWHEQRASLLEAALAVELGEDQRGGLLVWGDPSLYDSTLRLLAQLSQRGRVAFEHTVIPGITSVSALAASHRMPLHRVAGAVLITTGRRLVEQGLPEGVDDVVVMLDGECAFTRVPPEHIEIYWGAYLGTADEILIAGPLGERSGEIVSVREAARARHGWIMDIYLLRRTGRDTPTEA